MSATQVQVVLENFTQLSSAQISKFQNLYEIYLYWNNQINVLSRKDFDNFYLHHVLHSLSIAKYTRLQNTKPIVDLGCGGGFPSVPLAIYFENTEFVLIDSIGKKLKVVNEVCEHIGIKNIKTIHLRVEEWKGKHDTIISRAVATLPQLIQWSRHLKPTRLICLKGGDLDKEFETINQKQLLITPIKNYFINDYFNDKKIVEYFY